MIYNRKGSFDFCKSPDYVSFTGFDERSDSGIGEALELDYLYIDVYRLLCPDNTLGSCIVTANSRPMFYDRDHLTLEFATFLAEKIKNSYRTKLAARGLPPLPWKIDNLYLDQ
jgi:hypothetical protein